MGFNSAFKGLNSFFLYGGIPYLTFNRPHCGRCFAAFLILPRQTTQQYLTRHLSYFAVHCSLPFYQSMLYNTPVNETNVINLRCPDFSKWNTITMGDTSSQASLNNIVPCVTVINIAAHAITPKLLFVQFITSYYIPVLQKIQVFWNIKV